MMNYQDTSAVERMAKFRKIQKARRTDKNKKQNKRRNRSTESSESVTYENTDSNAESSKNASDENSTGSNAIQDESRCALRKTTITESCSKLQRLSYLFFLFTFFEDKSEPMNILISLSNRRKNSTDCVLIWKTSTVKVVIQRACNTN
jgi:hypothetical protein